MKFDLVGEICGILECRDQVLSNYGVPVASVNDFIDEQTDKFSLS